MRSSIWPRLASSFHRTLQSRRKIRGRRVTSRSVAAELSTVTEVLEDRTLLAASFLDIDIDGQYQPLSDGLVLLRRFAGFDGEPLTAGAVNDLGQRTDSSEIANAISDLINSGRLDIDLDGQTLPLADGVLIIRYLAGFTGGTLTSGAVNPEGERTTVPEIERYLDELKDSGSLGLFTLAEGEAYATEHSEAVDLGVAQGTRTLSIDLDVDFDTFDSEPVVNDLFQIYLVDTNDPSTTLLDRGEPGTSLFSLGEDGADYIPGRVRYDGSTVEIDVSSVDGATSGNLLFQLLDNDADNTSRVTVLGVRNVVDADGTPTQGLSISNSVRDVGPTTDVNAWTATSEVSAEVSNVRYDSSSGRYEGDLKLRNQNLDSSSNIAVTFPNLASGVTLTNASGTDANGNPYLNLRPAISSGGLARGFRSATVPIRLQNSAGEKIALTPVVLVGPTNQAPEIDAPGTLTVMPGEMLEVPLTATDPDTDSISWSIRSDVMLPNASLSARGVLSFLPNPSHVGSYSFDVVASDGVASVSQMVNLEVTADPLTTTRYAGTVLNTRREPLVGLRLTLGTLETTTDAQGKFMFETATEFDSESIEIHGDTFESDDLYPYLKKKLSFFLDQDMTTGGLNKVHRTIFMPILDTENTVPIQQSGDTMVTNAQLPGVMLMIEDGSAVDESGNPLTGNIGVMEVALDLTPRSLPANLSPDTVYAIYTTETNGAKFNMPAAFSAPNKAGHPPGTMLDLWEVNPETQKFEILGQGRVSDDGAIIEAVNGGSVSAIGGNAGANWRTYVPVLEPVIDDTPSPLLCGCPKPTATTGSEVEIATGTYLEDHQTATYQSLGATRGVELRYDSLRANPNAIVPFRFEVTTQVVQFGTPTPESAQFVMGRLDVTSPRGVTFAARPNASGLSGRTDSESFWQLPDLLVGTSIGTAIPIDLGQHPTGVFDYSLTTGLYRNSNSTGALSGSNSSTDGALVSVNSIDSAFGSGWSVSGLQYIVESAEQQGTFAGSVLLVDGNGSEWLFVRDSTVAGAYVSPTGDFSVLRKAADGTFKRTMKNGTIYQFNAANRLDSVTDRNGNRTNYIYSSAGDIERIIDPAGLETSFAYSEGRVVEIRNPAGAATTLTYDSSGNLSRITDADGAIRRFEYDAQHLLTKETTPLEQSEFTSYDARGRVTEVVRSDGTRLQLQAVATQALTAVGDSVAVGAAPMATTLADPASVFLDGAGGLRQDSFDEFGQVNSANDSIGRLLNVNRNSNGLPTARTDGNGNTRTYRYDGRGNVTSTSDTVVIQASSLGELFTGRKYIVGDLPTAVATGDFNGDGLLDFASANNWSNDVSVLTGNPDGSFTSAGTFAVGRNPNSITSGDVNGDGLMDIVTANSGSHDVSLLLGDGTGQFAQATSLPVGTRPAEAVVSDLNADGVFDIVVANQTSATVSVLMSDGNGQFFPQTQFNVAGAPSSVAVGDFDSDGIPDLITSSSVTDDVSYLPGAGEGQFGVERRLSIGHPTVATRIGDFNGDRHLDLAGVTELGTISFMMGDGRGAFEAPVQTRATNSSGSYTAHNILSSDVNVDGISDLVLSGGIAVSAFLGREFGVPGEVVSTIFRDTGAIAIGNFDGDGIPDLVVSNPHGDDLSIIQGSGGGRFLESESLASGSGWIIAEDFDNDAVTDLAVAKPNSGSVAVLMGTGSGRFEEIGEVSTPPSFNAILSSDVNNDSIPDLIVANGGVVIHVGNGDGTFQEALSLNVPGRPIFVVPHDFNYDGNMDIATANDLGGSATILFGDGLGGFVTSQELTTGGRPRHISVKDFNRDGVSDLVIAIPGGGGSGLGELAIFHGLRDGTFSQAQQLSAFNPYRVETDDFNADGHIDLAVLNQGRDSVTILLGDVTGAFERQQLVVLSEGTRDLVTGDWNGDGIPDLATVNSNHDDISIILGNEQELFRELRFAADVSGVISITGGDLNADGLADLAVSGFGGTVALLNQSANFEDVSPKIFTYDSVFHQLTSETDELGRQTLYEIDPANGNRLSTNRVVGELDSVENEETDDVVTSFTYTTHGQIDRQTDPLGRITDYDYDQFGRLSQTTYAKGTVDEAIQRFEYDTAGNQTAFIDENQNRTEFTYDAVNRLRQITEPDPDGPTGPLTPTVTQFFYDAAGNLIRTIDANGSTTTNTYDEMNRLADTSDDAGNKSNFKYDFNGNLVAVQDPNGNTTRNTYDARDRLVLTTDPDGGKTQFRYDGNDNLILLVDPVGNRTRFVYDARDRLIREVDPLGEETRYRYDAVDNLIAKTDRNGRISRFEYDDLDRLITETWIEADETTIANTIHYTYDAVGNLLTTVDNVSSLTYAYDARNRVKTTDNTGTLPGSGLPTVVLTYDYDEVGNVVSVAETIDGAAGATTAYEFDALNRMTSVQQFGTGVNDKLVDFSYNQVGQFDQIRRYSDLTRSNLVAASQYTYDALNRLTSLEHGSTPDPRSLAFYDFEFDAASRITAITDIDGRTKYSYDHRDQLIAADRSATDVRGDESYTYDANGNRVESHLHNNGYVTGPGNRLLSDGTFNYEYDDEGIMVRKTTISNSDTREFEYDHRNRLFAVTDRTAEGVVTLQVLYVYDSLNRRIARTSDADGNGTDSPTTEHFVYDRDDVLLDFIDADGSENLEQPKFVARYLFGPGVDQILAKEDIESDQTNWLLANHLGTIRDIVDETGTLVNHVQYDSFGNVVSQGQPHLPNRYLYTAREFDSVAELYYYRARFYDPTSGRFISEDPIGFNGSGSNLFQYVANSPLVFVDPTGLKETCAQFMRRCKERACVLATCVGNGPPATSGENDRGPSRDQPSLPKDDPCGCRRQAEAQKICPKGGPSTSMGSEKPSQEPKSSPFDGQGPWPFNDGGGPLPKPTPRPSPKPTVTPTPKAEPKDNFFAAPDDYDPTQ